MAAVTASAVGVMFALNKYLDDKPKEIVVRCLEYVRDLIPHKHDIIRKADVEKLSPEQLDDVVRKVKKFAESLVQETLKPINEGDVDSNV